MRFQLAMFGLAEVHPFELVIQARDCSGWMDGRVVGSAMRVYRCPDSG
jgi:hypothetical protein